MKNQKNVENLIKNTKTTASNNLDNRVHNSIKHAQENQKTTSNHQTLNIWRIIINHKIAKIGIAAVIIFAIVLGVNIFDNSASPVWAIEQTVKALENIETLFISGTSAYYTNKGQEQLPFKCWVKFDSENSKLFMRYESQREICVVQDEKIYAYSPRSKKLRIIEGDTVQNLKFWYKALELSPWLTGKVIQLLRLNASDWHEEFITDPQTGKEIVNVTCTYEPLSASFHVVFDSQTKLIIRAKHFDNPNHKGTPNMYADNFVYNKEIPDEIFEFEIDCNDIIISRATPQDTDRAQALFEQEDYPKALELYQKAGDFMMVGICYASMGQYEMAIQSYLKEIKIRPDFDGSLSATYFYLGAAYLQTQNKEKAVEAFENCIKSGKDFRDPGKFPIKHAREAIEKVKSQ